MLNVCLLLVIIILGLILKDFYHTQTRLEIEKEELKQYGEDDEDEDEEYRRYIKYNIIEDLYFDIKNDERLTSSDERCKMFCKYVSSIIEDTKEEGE